MKKIAKAAIIAFSAVFLSTGGIGGGAFAAAAAPSDPMFKSQWGHYNTGQKIGNRSGAQGVDANILNAWEFTKGSGSVVVGILDTGIDMSHEDLSGICYTNPGEIPGNGVDDDKNGYIDDVNGWDFVNGDNTVYDNATDDSHGTALAGVIAAAGNNGKGICGVAPNVKILPLKFRNGLMVDADRVKGAIEAIAYAKAMGVKIINCSFTCFNSSDLKKAIEESGILFICAPGNSGLSLDDRPSYPCCYDLPNVLGVASVNSRGDLSSFSSYGLNVTLAAPGEDVLTTRPGNQYSYSSGTSLSVPYVTGVAALIQSLKPSLSANDIAEVIKASVRPMDSLSGKIQTGGLLDAYNALKNISSITASSEPELSLSGTEGTDGWYRSDVTAAIHPGDSSKLNILYSFDKQKWEKYEVPVIIKQNGKINLYYCVENDNGMKIRIVQKEIRIDRSKPEIVLLSPEMGETFVLGSKIALQYYINDDLSGVKGKNRFAFDTDYIPADKIGANTLKLTAEDKAGNLALLNVNFKVIYKDPVLLEPKEGKALKSGDPLAIKLKVTNVEDAVVETAKIKLFTAFMNNGTAAEEAAAKSALAANAGNGFIFDKALKQYTYSLSTKGLKPGKWRLRIELDDGTSKYVNIVLK